MSEIILKNQAGEGFSQAPDVIIHEQMEAGRSYDFKLRDNLLVSVIKHDVTREDLPDADVENHVKKCDEKLSQMMKKVNLG